MVTSPAFPAPMQARNRNVQIHQKMNIATLHFSTDPRQHDSAVAFREIGRVERTLFMIDWALDVDMRRRANLGLNKGEAHHALKNARGSDARERSAPRHPRPSIFGSQGSTFSQRSQSTGVPSNSDARSRNANCLALRRHWIYSDISRARVGSYLAHRRIPVANNGYFTC